ncbi:MAG: spermidine synthase [Chloroflexia bacterium]
MKRSRACTPGFSPTATLFGLFLLSAGTLLFEVNLTRLFSVAQFYHFAFLVISLAMLGYGASGTALALFPSWVRRRSLSWLALAGALSTGGAYLLSNVLPFDSFTIAWDRRQLLILALDNLALAVPFFCSGAVLGLLFVLEPGSSGRFYAANLAGSALGGLLALLAPSLFGGEGTVLLSGLLSGLSALLLGSGRLQRGAACLAVVLYLAGLLLPPPFLEVRLSPYKGLSDARQFPDSTLTFRRWNGFSRVDRVQSSAIRSLPGLSYTYLAPLPPQQGLFVDGDDLSAVLELDPSLLEERPLPAALDFTGYLPTAIAYRLHRGGQALVLEPRGGLEIWVALAQGAAEVTAVEANPLIVEAAGAIYRHPHVGVVVEDARSFVRRTSERYDVVTLALSAPYRPIQSGAYSLAEDYHNTIEAFGDYLARLRPGGVLVVSRWLQMPPSEELRTFALALTAVERAGGEPARQIVALRGYAMLTLLVKAEPFMPAELDAIRRFAAERALDLVYAPDIRPEEANRYNVLREPVYYETFRSLLEAEDRPAWYAAYPFEVSPPEDDRPFFGHFFKWSQIGEVVAEAGRRVEPFGGAGYLVLLLLLAVALGAAVAIVLLPLLFRRRTEVPPGPERPLSFLATLAYFGLLGLAYLLVEIPLVQQFILFLGHPAYALTVVLFALLLFSGLGSALSARLPLRPALALLVLVLVLYPFLLPSLFARALGWPFGGRVLLSVLVLSPAGMLMGVPFPAGLRRLEQRHPRRIPWAWGVNGAASVVAAVLAALLSLSFGFRWVLFSGAFCYAGAFLSAGRERAN